jgi:two-component system, response regulator PdtaR
MSSAMKSIDSGKSCGEHRILICEDNHLIAMGWASLLAMTGYNVVGPAHTGEKALEMAYQHLPHLALVDIGLKGAIDGISVAAELAPLGVIVIFVTADYQRAALEGREYAREILIKPVVPGTILNSVASILQNKPRDLPPAGNEGFLR